MALTIDFDIIIYKFGNNTIKGYFAVDFVPDGKPFRPCHNPNCNEKCHYGKHKPRTFYKEISFEIAQQLFEEGLIIHNDFLNKKETNE